VLGTGYEADAPCARGGGWLLRQVAEEKVGRRVKDPLPNLNGAGWTYHQLPWAHAWFV